MPKLSTVKDILRALGPRQVDVSRRYGVSVSVVNNWISRGRIPARYFLIMSHDLLLVGQTAEPSAWGLAELTPQLTPRTVYSKSRAQRKNGSRNVTVS